MTYAETMATQEIQASSEAENLLAQIWFPLAGDQPFPVDPVKIARSLGMDVFITNLDMGLSGAMVKEVGQDPAIFLNEADSYNRRRFTCAHEIGHYVLRSRQDDQYQYVDRRDYLSSKGKDPVEKFANQFAANLLMPMSQLEELRRQDYSDLQLANYFGVSMEAMTIRLEKFKTQ